MSLTNEDFLDRFFSGATPSQSQSTMQHQNSLPGMPEGQVWADFGQPAAATATSPRSTSGGSPHKTSSFNSNNGASGANLTRFSPVWQTTPPPGTATGTAVGPLSTAASGSLSTGGDGSNRGVGTSGNPALGGTASTSQGGGGSGSGQVGNPFNTNSSVHRRVASQASSHQRTLSAGSDPWGSMPGTPGAVEGPERSIIAPFVAEMEGEISVDVGDKVKVGSDIGGWARVLKLSDAKVGLVPSWAVGEE